MNRQRGFTLIELMVISIVSL
ncbi:prepilin-type N-terminal cleavage/methylation domain-containing protein [Atlantibacter hermannii]